MQWETLAASSHYQTAVAIRDELTNGHFSAATAGIEELVEALSRSEQRALKSQLIRLMAHIIKWTCQSERRSRSWAVTIHSARAEILDIQEETPSLNDEAVRRIWAKCFRRAKTEAEEEMGQRCDILELGWDEVFDVEYSLLGED